MISLNDLNFYVRKEPIETQYSYISSGNIDSYTSVSSYSAMYSSTSTLSSLSSIMVYSYINNMFYPVNSPLTGQVFKFINIASVNYGSTIKPTSLVLSADDILYNDYKVYDKFYPYNYGIVYYNSTTSLSAGHIFYDHGLIVIFNSSVSLTSPTASNLSYIGIQNNQYLSATMPVYQDYISTSNSILNCSDPSLTGAHPIYNRFALIDNAYNTLAGFTLTGKDISVEPENFNLRISF